MFYLECPFFSANLYYLMYLTTSLVPTIFVIFKIWSMLSVPCKNGILLKIFIIKMYTMEAKIIPADHISTL